VGSLLVRLRPKATRFLATDELLLLQLINICVNKQEYFAISWLRYLVNEATLKTKNNKIIGCNNRNNTKLTSFL
jgi:hypothetical protein